MPNLLTIAIPTYNRKSSVAEILRTVTNSKLHSHVEVMVVDDASTDGTSDFLQIEFPLSTDEVSGIRILRHETNRGMAAGFLRMFEECKTEYLMMFADDDDIYPNGVLDVIEALSVRRVDFLCPVWLSTPESGAHSVRGRSYPGAIPFSELRIASNHAPGLVYRVDAVRPWIQYLNAELAQGQYAVRIFPQVIAVLLIALSGGRMEYCPAAPGGYRAHGALPSGLCDEQGNHWSSLNGRWREQLSFDRVYSLFESEKTPLANLDSGHAGRLQALCAKHRYEAFARLRGGVAADKPDLLDHFDAGAVLYVIRNPTRAINLLLGLLKFALRARA